MKYEEFIQGGHLRYEQFARTVAAILQAAIDAQSQDFRLQQIRFRAKDAKSLKRKLTERGLLESNVIEEELKDLAGCRLIFYTNTDVDRFLGSRLIFENFVVDFDGSKFHHAVGTDRSAEELYFAIHYLVSLKEERLSLPEYAQFRGMRCEVQLQTILNHAWAETSHDILYHPASMQGFGTKQFEDIKNRLGKIMNQYLLPAGYEFQKVQHDYERLIAGKELFERGTLELLGQAKDNNERYEQLQRIRKDLLPFYDDVPAVAPEVIRLASDAIKKARGVATIPIQTPFGDFDGHSTADVADEALQIIDNLRYVDIALTFQILCDLYATSNSEAEKTRLDKSFEALARNDINVWRQVGFGVQKVVYDAIRALPSQERDALRSVIVTVGRFFLDTELQGTTWHFNSVSLQRGAVQPSTAYSDFRRDVISLLFDLYDQASTQKEKLEIVHALSVATRFPMDSGRAELIGLVLDNTLQIVEFFSGRLKGEPFEITQHLEHQFLWLYRRTKELAAGHADAAVRTKAGAVVGAIETFRDRANSNDRFVKFKTLVGFESVFPPEWNGNSMDIEGPQAFRSDRITEYASSVTSANADEWYEILKLCASVKSDDLATFPSFGEFLKQLAAGNAPIAIGYLKKDEELLGGFLPAILGGLEESEHPEDGVSLINEWTEQGRHLAAIARYLRFSEKTPIDVVVKVGQQALKLKDPIAAIETLATIIARQLVSLVDSVFLPVLSLLTELNDARWINVTWFMPALRPFLASLSEDQCRVLLNNLVLRERIDHHDEWVLREIAGKYPGIVWHFFKHRIDRKDAGTSEGRYEPIPYGMSELSEPLARDAGLAVQIVRSWYSSEDKLFTYVGGRLLHNVFSTFTSEFEAELLALVRSRAAGDIDFVVSVLRSYQGGHFLHEVCKELVEVLPEGDNRIDEVEVILQSTGTVTGEFGLVEAYQARKEEVASWLTDRRAKVRAFAEKYQRTMDRSIAAEQRRSETDYELRRRDWAEEE